MSTAVRALRGATTVDADTPEQIASRTAALLEEMFDRNGVDHDDLISIWFTVTDDISSAFPASAARAIGLGDVPLPISPPIVPATSCAMCTSRTPWASATTCRARPDSAWRW